MDDDGVMLNGAGKNGIQKWESMDEPRAAPWEPRDMQFTKEGIMFFEQKRPKPWYDMVKLKITAQRFG